MNDMADLNLMKNACVENLMLISAFGEAVYRRLAISELQQRKLINDADSLGDDFMTTLNVVF